MDFIANPAVAQAVVDKALEYEALTDYDKSDVVGAANEVLGLLLDAWQQDDIQPDHEDPDLAAMGAAVKEIFDIAGVDPDQPFKTEPYEEDFTVAKGYTFKVRVNADGTIQFAMPESFDPDDMEPVLTPEQIEQLGAKFHYDDKVMFGIIASLMSLDELEEWGLITLRASNVGRRIQERQ